VFVELLAKNAQKCRKIFAQLGLMGVLQERTNFAKYATVLLQKVLSCVLNAMSSHAKPPRKDQ
jgi:hypothetical protein